ncbi:regulatory protein GemA [Pectobacterium brasiliense]|uniref:gp16 family protein n=1 Tax=Pectobacterium brasiliense TaxID=180957 RepID=UPI000CE6894C|nr:regulatory protein GemA [Pectobacterium brasiliense]MBN3045301.1 regulatory protein GemA [Pectobacterium brasiliense]MBN3182981.1 regulatory protein GemA [Pectobacterium brasiliense]PPE64374.1 GemA protein [Pectobacterium brasiliense]
MNIQQRRMIGAIKAGQSALGWDDATYRSVLARITGKSSSTLCTITELEKVKEYMHKQGWPRKAKNHGRKPSVPTSKKSVLSKVEALLVDAGRPWQYAETMAKNMFGVRYVDWLDIQQLTKLMQALIIDAKRRKKAAEE